MATGFAMLLQFPLALLKMGLGTALFTGAAHKLLPPQVRFRSPGFLGVVVTFFLVGFFRHSLVLDADPMALAVSLTVYLGLLFVLFSPLGVDCLALALCASIGVDMLVGLAVATGLTESPGSTGRAALLAWELLATFWVIRGRVVSKSRPVK